jgi:prepilin-type N-terminal cleavage/methylation domain-containing protein
MRRPQARGGFTLLELMLAMLIGGAILSAGGVLMARVIRANAEAAEHLRGVVGLGRLGEQFRRDVHASTAATVVETAGQPQRLRLRLSGDVEVEYAPAPGCVLRTEAAGGQQRSRDAFVVGSMKALGFQVPVDASGAVSIVIGRPARRPGLEDVVSGKFEITAIARRADTSERKP